MNKVCAAILFKNSIWFAGSIGLTAMPFGLYMGVSAVIVSLYSAAFILFGDALVHGRGKMAFLAVSLFVAFTVGVKFLRRHYQRRQAKSS